MLKFSSKVKNVSITDKLLELREIAGDDQHQIIRYHLLVARYLRMKTKHTNLLNTYAEMQGIQ